MTTTRRTRFNLAGFLEELRVSIEDSPDMIDDIVQRYKDFLSKIEDPLLTSVKKYVNSHVLVVEDERLRSFVTACHRSNFEK